MKLTDSAINKVRELLDEELDPELKLRVSVNGGGCSGFKYDLGFDNTQAEDDITVEMESNGVTVPVIVDALSMTYLSEVIIDYTDGLMAQFVITNPSAVSTCGCGSSFSV
jgi:iron-sulfur cluster insertion protein